VVKMKYTEDMKQFYAGKRVFLTGHTGFKGSWLSVMLRLLGAEVYGYALQPESDPDLFSLLGLQDKMHSTIADIRDFARLKEAVREAKPDCVLHLAAQPLVRESYRYPRETYETNVMGTVNLLEAVRELGGVESFLNVTTDKVYENPEQANHGFTEDEKLDGYDPYSNSKSCSELVTHSYQKSFFSEPGAMRISTARAGNVIGGGDFAKDRIIPDCVRATVQGKAVELRNPYSTRPYQHVLEPLYAYLMIVMQQAKDAKYAGYYNVGPDDCDCVSTGELADLFVKHWGEPAAWKNVAEANAPHEAGFLKLDCAKLKKRFGWAPIWHVDQAVGETVHWYQAWAEGKDLNAVTEEQIRNFLSVK
jgi:CDP-glucose 4,6-dehydratase